MTADNFCFYLQNRQFQTSQTGGQLYSDSSSFSIPWLKPHLHWRSLPQKTHEKMRQPVPTLKLLLFVALGTKAGPVIVRCLGVRPEPTGVEHLPRILGS